MLNFPRHEPEIEQRKELKMTQLRRREEERVRRFIQNPTKRLMGLDVTKLKEQERMKQTRLLEMKEEEKVYSIRNQQLLEQLNVMEIENERRKRQEYNVLRDSWTRHRERNEREKRTEREEFTKDISGRIQFQGEDKNHRENELKKMNIQRTWLEEQMKLKRDARIKSKIDVENERHRSDALSSYQDETEIRDIQMREERIKRVADENKEMARSYREAKEQEKERELEAERRRLIAYENAASASDRREGPLSTKQMKDIQIEQRKQREERSLRSERMKAETRADLRQIKQMNRAMASADEEAERARLERDREHFDTLRKMIEEKEAANRRMKEEIKHETNFGNAFFSRFGSSAR